MTARWFAGRPQDHDGGTTSDVPEDSLVRRLAMAHDASHYRLIPERVVRARSREDVAREFRSVAGAGGHVTLRSGGTSLSGQASGAGTMIDTRTHFQAVEVLDGGARVRVQPGATLRTVNARLAPFGTRLGPDPASEGACTVGGVIANNSSGMRCGTQWNSYSTLDGLAVVLVDGTVVDTSLADADLRLRHARPDLYEGLLRLRDRVRGNHDSIRRINQLYALKNTMGYSLNAFTDFTEPTDILAHLMVGSEGTLGFVSDVVLRTIPIRRHVATAFLVFPSIAAATDAIAPLSKAGACTLELIDAASLRVCQGGASTHPVLRSLEVRAHTALLAELEADSQAELNDLLDGAATLLDDLNLVAAADFEQDAASRAAMWKLRKDLYPRVAAARPSGSTALLEDVAVPITALTGTVNSLHGLLRGHGYHDSVTFGHAKDGNLHFMISCRFDDPAEVDRYAAFNEDLVGLVLNAGGTLKAEHGTGRMMAPFVERQFGAELYAVIREVKRLFDPAVTLNPGVVVSDNARQHLADLKVVPLVEADIDTCTDCGYCEPMCPSRALTTTPRQRIALLREAKRLAGSQRAGLMTDYEYHAVDTCAADSLCSVACPVHIDTGALMKRARATRHSSAAQKAAVRVADRFGVAVAGARAGVGLARKLPTSMASATTSALRRVGNPEWIPSMRDRLPGPGRRRTAQSPPNATYVYFPACVTSIFGPDYDHLPALAALGGEVARVPEQIASLCCATPWASKGFSAGAQQMAERTATALWLASEGGRLPVVCNASSCAWALQTLTEQLPAGHHAKHRRLSVLDAVTFVRRHVMPKLGEFTKIDTLAVHPTCADVHMNTKGDVLALAHDIADEVVVPTTWGCCGFAGDRGLLHPELTAAATAPMAAEIASREFGAYASTNRTCEMAMTRATGAHYRDIIAVLCEVVMSTRG
ncbi:hypothetical protein AWC19_24160 [Mycobacterium palustre]|uniref:D-lactate dehydrogenase (cytochrome) n=1 Tax=Mycobacterium palustre TaxID=153971 RepID=A0A1X2A1B7_9MYCO|nr:hypothetical protein AWC19_24160 [Mycobacterium palustre]